MSTLVDQARQYSSELLTGNPMKLALSVSELLLQLADRVQELEGEPATDDLRARCAEILGWRKTGILKGEKLRKFAEVQRWRDDPHALMIAENETAREAFQALLASPPSSVQPEKEERRPLTDEQLNAIAREVFPQDPVADAWSEQWDKEVGRPFARAIEAAHGIKSSPSMVGREGEA